MLSTLRNIKRKLQIAATYRQAVKGCLPAQHEIGKLYHELGDDYFPQAFAWLTIAGNHGRSRALSEIIILQAELTLTQLNEGRKLALEYKRNYDTMPR